MDIYTARQNSLFYIFIFFWTLAKTTILNQRHNTIQYHKIVHHQGSRLHKLQHL